jgi:hypothetical protein
LDRGAGSLRGILEALKLLRRPLGFAVDYASVEGWPLRPSFLCDTTRIIFTTALIQHKDAMVITNGKYKAAV